MTDDTSVNDQSELPDVIIPENVEEVLENLPEESRNEIISLIETRMSFEKYSGPIPHPTIMGHYEHIAPGSANRILTMSEKQMEHRQEIEKLVVRAGIRREFMGMVLGFILSIAVMIGGFGALFLGFSAVGVGLIATPAITIAGVYAYQTRSNQHQLENKRKALDKPSSPELPETIDKK
ncbi:MAG: DUF2335 domain-containing protein [Aggregatilineales bacterium]